MAIFGRLYDRVLCWSTHQYATWYLAGLSFAESSFFPVPPDVMLAPMSLARPKRAFSFALLTTIASTFGGLAGYLIGLYGIELVVPWIERLGYAEAYQQAREWFEQWGVWVVFIAGFSPIPYKVFTISAGAASMALLPFIIASFFGRGARFFLVAGLIYLGGEKMTDLLRKYIDRIGWILVVAVVVLYFIIKG